LPPTSIGVCAAAAVTVTATIVINAEPPRKLQNSTQDPSQPRQWRVGDPRGLDRADARVGRPFHGRGRVAQTAPG
jgi:hypothetical protein